jgi:hypothetical protein
MKRFVAMGVVLSVAVMCQVPQRAAAAGKYDGSAPVICGAMLVAECGAEGRCQRRSAENVNLPSLFRIDVKAMKTHNLEAEKGRVSPIKAVEHANGRLLLQGVDGDRGWTIVIHEESGKMSATVSADSEGFVVFGQCALP